MSDVEGWMSGLDAPTALPADLRDRLEMALTDEPLMVGLDAPRPLSKTQRERLSESLLGAATAAAAPDANKRARTWLTTAAAAAAVIVLVAGATIALRRSPSHSISTAAGPRATAPSTTAPPQSGATAIAPPAPALSPQASAASGSNGAAGITAGGSASAGTGSAPSAPYLAPPPFYSTPSSPEAAALPSSASPAPPPPPPAPIVVVGGDAAEAAGFNAYLAALNQSPSVHLTLVPQGGVATVNLSDTPLPSTTPGPVLETLPVPESILHSPVFDAASAPVHQADLAVAAVFPKPAAGRIATIYRGTQGVWATDVPDAMAAALQKRGVTVVTMTYRPGQAFHAGPGDAAFLALDTADAKAWFTAAAGAGYHPPLGVTGIESLVEPSLLASLPDGTRAVGPYDIPTSAETTALTQSLGREPGMAEIHGWVTAKLLATALWQQSAPTAAATTAALQQLVGYNDGFNPPIAWRKGATSRTPDGVLFTVHARAFTTTHVFETDPAP